jgi:hypothetical protein
MQVVLIMNIITFFALQGARITTEREIQETIRRARFRAACSSIETSGVRAAIEHRVLLESHELKIANPPVFRAN